MVTCAHVTNKKQHLFIKKTYSHRTWQSGGLWQGTTKIASCFYHLVTWYHVGNEKQYVFNPLSPPQPNLTWWWLLIGGQHPFRHWHFGRVLMCGHATNGKCYIFFSTKPQVNKHGRVVVLDKGLLTTKSRDSSIKWSRKKHRNLIYPLSPGLWPPNRTGWLLKLSQVKRTFGHVVAWDYVANEVLIHFLGPKVMSSKREWEWLYERLLSKKAHDLLVM